MGRTRKVERKPARGRKTRYTSAGVALLAAVDTAYEDLSGPAVRRLLQQAHDVFGETGFSKQARISVSPIYNLRRSEAYRTVHVEVHHTRGGKVSSPNDARRSRCARTGMDPGLFASPQLIYHLEPIAVDPDAWRTQRHQANISRITFPPKSVSFSWRPLCRNHKRF
jgi:hypothetical protein